MKNRCNNPTVKTYPRYGGRGIKVCERWLESFENFYEDMGERPSSQHSLDRIDNDGDYSPENCRWATKQEQGNNKRNNVLIEYNGKCLSVIEWAKHLNVEPKAIYHRISRGWSNERTITQPFRQRNNLSKINVYSKQHPISDEQYLNSIFGDH